MKLCLRLALLRGVAPAGALALLVTGCSSTANAPSIPDAADGGASNGGNGGTNGNGSTDPSSPPDPPHALGTITLGETHTAGASAATPLVSAFFAPDTTAVTACTKTLGGCRVPIVAKCDGIAAPSCGSDEYCALDASCTSTCKKVCTQSCGSDEVCYFATPTAMACRKIETFDAGALAFAGTTTPLTLYPPYTFIGSGVKGAPFLAGASIEVQGSGATAAGFDKFDETFTATTFLQTSPSLAKLPLTQIWGTGTIPVGWVPGSDSVVVSVTGLNGVAECDATDSTGHFDIPRAVVAAVSDLNAGSLSVQVTRKRVETKKDGKTKGTLSAATVQPVGFLQLTTSSTESASFASCGQYETPCGDHCSVLSDSSTDCGACGNSCGTGYCSNGKCQGVTGNCAFPKTTCNGLCVDTTTDNNNCGSCGNVCASGQICFESGCN